MAETYDVIVAGAGPIGLFLACELGLAGVSVLVLEKDSTPDSLWKIEPLGLRGINTPSVENFYRRGMLSKLTNQKERPTSIQKTSSFQFGGHFAGLMLDANKLDLDRFRYRLPGPALIPTPATIERIETVLAERAQHLGVKILRGNSVTRIVAQDEAGVTIEAGENKHFRSRWIVGCDGGRSMIRKAAGFEFVGTEPKFTGYVAKCEWDHPEKLKPGWHVTEKGMHIIRMPDTLYLTDFDDGAFDRTQELTHERLQSVFERTTGVTDVKITKIHITSTFTDRCKQVTSYRKGRVLLAGDAAHIHSPLGAQGLNLGLGDAMNLGWKLAATVRQEAANGGLVDLTLLDTYESERQPIGAWALEWTRAQVSMLQPNPYGAALQSLIRGLIDTTDGTNFFIDRFMGLSQRYQLDQDLMQTHPLVGCSAPDFELQDGSRLGSRLEGGQGLLVDLQHNVELADLIAGKHYVVGIEYINMDVKDRRDLRALLIRPDGIVAWATAEHSKLDIEAARSAISRWFG